MRLVARSGQSLIEQRREQSRRKRAAAGTLSSEFPTVERVRIELSFPVTSGPAPAAQAHVMYPPAPAYFEFACPYGDCDGGFDLNEIASSIMTSSTLHAQGTVQCSGSRIGMSRLPCSLNAHYRVAAEYETRTGSKK